MKNKHFYILTIFFLLYIHFYEISLGQNYWEKLNGPYGGNVKSILINKNGSFFICTDYKLFRSDNKGKDWNLMKDTSYITAITSTPNGNLLAGDVSNIYRSADNGKSWNIVYSKGDWTINIEKIFCTTKGEIFASGGGGLFRSTDDGLNWSQLYKDLFVPFFIYKDDLWFYSNSVQLFYSTDRGGDWYPTYQMVNTVISGIIKDSNGVLIASTQYNGMFKSIDTAKSWISINKGLDTLRILSLAMNSRNMIFIGSNGYGIYYSTDLGNNWQHTGLTEGIVNTIVIDSNNNLYAGTKEFGFCYSNDDGKSWVVMNNGIQDWVMKKMSLDSEGNILMFTGYFPSILKTTDNGKTWEQKRKGLKNASFLFTFAENNQKELLLGTARGVYKSTDNGESWKRTSSGLLDGTNVHSILFLSNGDILISCMGEGAMYSSTGVYRSTDNGNTWIPTSMSMPAISMVINSKGEIFAGTWGFTGNGSGFYKSTDNGISWTYTGGKGLSITSSLINNNGYIFAGTDGKGMYRSTDDNITFIAVNNGLTFSKFDIFDNLINDGLGRIYASANADIYLSSNNGDSWIDISKELTGKRMKCMVVNPEGYLFISAGTGEVYKSKNPVTSVLKDIGYIPEKFSLEQNYPNPFNPFTVINYKLPVNCFVTIKAYDILGKEVVTLINEEKQAGNYSVYFDSKTKGGDLPSGIYIYKMTAGKYTDVKKMILTK